MPRTLLAALAGLGLAAAALAPALAQDAPMATAPNRATTTAPAAAPMLGQSPTAPPTDDYGYVAWCYGAVAGYVDLYDTAMPEVTRIERAFPTPSTEENIAKVYPEQRDAAKASLLAYREALTAAEMASARPINAVGAQALNRGRTIWAASRTVPKAQLAQFWMGWSAPAECDSRAQTLLTKSKLFGQALSFNAQPVPPEPEPAPEASSTGPVATSIDDLLASAATTPAAPESESASSLRGPL